MDLEIFIGLTPDILRNLSKFFIPVALALIAICFNSCSKDDDLDSNAETFTDSRDGKSYNTVKIGNQW